MCEFQKNTSNFNTNGNINHLITQYGFLPNENVVNMELEELKTQLKMIKELTGKNLMLQSNPKIINSRHF